MHRNPYGDRKPEQKISGNRSAAFWGMAALTAFSISAVLFVRRIMKLLLKSFQEFILAELNVRQV